MQTILCIYNHKLNYIFIQLIKQDCYKMLMSTRMNCLNLFRNIRPHPLLFNTSSVKFISQHPLKYLETQNMWKEKDGISNRWQLIYKAPMVNLLNYATAYLTASTVTVACSCAYYAAFLYDKDTFNDPVVIGDDIVIANSTMEASIYLGAFILFHIAIKIVLSRYVVRMYQDGNNYLAVFRGNWFNSIVKHQFHLNEFKKLSPSLLITWSDAAYSLGKKKGILLEQHFKTPEYLNYLLYKKKATSSGEH